MNFKEMYAINVNDWTEEKNKLTYLSWAHAWRAFAEVYTDATYKIKVDENGIPAFGNNKLGYMVYTSVTVEGLTHEMWLPVMNHMNKTIFEPNMFEINKTIMRCLTKNLAMFGLGLYIYAGEDIPNDTDSNDKPQNTPQQEKPNQPTKLSDAQLGRLYTIASKKGYSPKLVNERIKASYRCEPADMTKVQYEKAVASYEAM